VKTKGFFNVLLNDRGLTVVQLGEVVDDAYAATSRQADRLHDPIVFIVFFCCFRFIVYHYIAAAVVVVVNIIISINFTSTVIIVDVFIVK
jgi:hypothetical protein